MKQAYLKSLQMIKQLNIKNEKEYNKLLKDYLILSSESLKYISRTRKFKKIVKLAEEVWKGFFCGWQMRKRMIFLCWSLNIESK